MKKSMLSVIIFLTAIVLMATFDFSLGPDTVANVPANMKGNALFICPAESSFWISMANGFGQFYRYITMGFFFAGIILTFVWGWSLYQNLLKDSFKKEDFSKPWAFTKLLFWAIVIMMIVFNTPNKYRDVTVDKHPGNWVLCENSSEGAVAVNSDLVHAK
ncbi:MAG: hypothetical protein J6Y07_00615 [Alphaproteobacteria bacterium]|nr:hypothetical protein [Alphaproteobacteria bacterium]